MLSDRTQFDQTSDDHPDALLQESALLPAVR